MPQSSYFASASLSPLSSPGSSASGFAAPSAAVLAPVQHTPADDDSFASVRLEYPYVLIHRSPFQLSVSTPLQKANALFHVLQLSCCVVCDEGEYVGILWKSDFSQLAEEKARWYEELRLKRKMVLEQKRRNKLFTRLGSANSPRSYHHMTPSVAVQMSATES
jgi:hypothetical protein